MMAVPTLIAAVLLIVVGVVGYATQDPDPEKGRSLTALIPAAVGWVLGICGFLAYNDRFRKHAMHLAAVVGVLGFLGGFMPLQRQYKLTGEVDPLKPSAVSGLLMSLICLVFVGLCVKSFIDARKARSAGQPPPA
jgi:hypothetical protein